MNPRFFFPKKAKFRFQKYVDQNGSIRAEATIIQHDNLNARKAMKGSQDTTAMRKNIRGLALLALAYIAFWPVEYSVAQDQPRARELS